MTGMKSVFKETLPDILSVFIYYTEKSALETSELSVPGNPGLNTGAG
jgi:hypothetical protein